MLRRLKMCLSDSFFFSLLTEESFGAHKYLLLLNNGESRGRMDLNNVYGIIFIFSSGERSEKKNFKTIFKKMSQTVRI